MSKTGSGLILIVIGVSTNLIVGQFVPYLMGRFVASHSQVLASPTWVLITSSPVFTGFFFLLIIGSLVVGLFGLFRLIVGLLSRKKPAKIILDTEANNEVWPPAPKSPYST